MLILASQSVSRQTMLEAAGIEFTAYPAHIDERALEAQLSGATAPAIATALAQAKAMTISQANPGRLVLGSDSLVEVAGRRFDKPANRHQAAEHLRFFSGRAMHLYSAAALVKDGESLWHEVSMAALHTIELSDEFIESYLTHEWPLVAGCVGVFRIEGRGVQLFERIDGDHFTVMGMPLLAVITALRKLGECSL